MHPIMTDLPRRIPKDKHYAGEVRRMVENCFSLQETLRFKRQEIAADRSLSHERKRAALDEYVTGEFACNLANASRGARAALANTASERASTFDAKRLKELDDLRDTYQVATAAAGIVQVDMADAIRTTPDRIGAIVQSL